MVCGCEFQQPAGDVCVYRLNANYESRRESFDFVARVDPDYTARGR